MPFFFVIFPFWFFAAVPLLAETSNLDGGGNAFRIGNSLSQQVLAINTREIEFGAIGPGEEVKRVITLRNIGSGSLDWSTEGPEGWSQPENQKLSGMAGENPETVIVSLRFLSEAGPGKLTNSLLLFRIEAGGQTAHFRRMVPIGTLRETIRFNYPGGSRTVFFNVRLSELASSAVLTLAPIRIDFGSVRPGDKLTQRVQIRNRGKETLKWRAGLAGKKGMPSSVPLSRERYLSFFNEASKGSGSYAATAHLREGLTLSGPWVEEGGYPVTQSDLSALRYRYTGTGISLIVLKSPEGGPISILVDEQFVTFIDGFSDRRELTEIPIIDNQPDAPHLLTVINGGGRVIADGVRILGKQISKGPPGWISIFPDSGTTTRETDYVNIALNTNQLTAGIYSDQVYFLSNGGDTGVEIFVEISADIQAQLLDVYRYLAGSDYLYTTNPQAEASRLQVKAYRNLGIAFRLFKGGTPGTTGFYRWFNPAKGDHYYSSDPAGGGKTLAGYLFEGSIGNIATIRVAGTRELYRWYNPSTGCHFYTTDQGGEGMSKNKYQFDGIAGYVR
jgi:hypothetical protein